MRCLPHRPAKAVLISFLFAALFFSAIYAAQAALRVTASAITFTPAVVERTRSTLDYVGSMDFTADPAYFVDLQSITLTFSGSALSNSAAPFSVTLKSLTGTTAQTCTPDVTNSCSVTFTPTYKVSAGATKSVRIRIDSSNFYDEVGVSESLTVSIKEPSDVLWSDGVTDNIPLETTAAPVIIASVLY